MAQPAVTLTENNRSDRRILVFWTTANSDPSWQFNIWLQQFSVAVTVKENVNPDLLLDIPKDVLEEASQGLNLHEL